MSDESTIIAVNPVIPVKQLDEAIEFYTDKLGFTLTFTDTSSEPATYAGVALNGHEIHLSQVIDPSIARETQLRFQVKNIGPLHQQMKDRGAPVGDIDEKPWHTKEFGVTDLNGVAIHFYEDR